jgi:transposase
VPEVMSRAQDLEAEALRRRVAELEARLASVTAERDKLRRAYEQAKEQLELIRRRIYVAKAERVDARQLELEFAEKKAALEKLAEELGISLQPVDADDEPRERRPKPKGRRNLREVDLPEERIEFLDASKEGRAERIGFEESCRLGYRRGGPVRIVIARATYKETDDATGETKIETVPVPKEAVRRSLLAPSMVAHLLYSKYGLGLPFYRQEENLRRQGIELDRGTMCRCAEDVGATLGAIVIAAAKEAKETAFCLSTDATGVLIQPAPLADGSRQACRKGHFFVVLADRDHVFFEYQPKHTSEAVCEMFRGYSGYIQADAHAIYDALFRGEATTGPPPQEVACWSHCRRHFWEAACAKYPLGREALLRIRNLFRLDQSWAELAPQKRHALRNEKLRPFVDEFFDWAREQYDRAKAERGLVASAFGYAVRQEQALRRFLDDGRLRMENNASERNLRPIAVGRKAWLFCGSDDHAEAAANLFSLIASCKLHRLDPELYLAEIVRVMPYWPRERYLELAPKYWHATRGRLPSDELAREIGPISVPPATAEQQTAAY